MPPNIRLLQPGVELLKKCLTDLCNQDLEKGFTYNTKKILKEYVQRSLKSGSLKVT